MVFRVGRSSFGETPQQFPFLCFGRHICRVPFRAEEEINLPMGAIVHTQTVFEELFFILYGAIYSESPFENRQTLTFI